MKLSEKLLHFIWRYKLINQSNLNTSEGVPLRILNFGKYNNNAGPDFEFAKIEIDQEVLVGHIEIHWFASEWYKHKHHEDSRYNTTILHVVWSQSDSASTIRQDGTTVPTLELEHIVDRSLLEKYQYLMEQEAWMPCEKHLPNVSDFQKSNWIDRIIVERLELKMELFHKWLEQTNHDWEKIQLIAISRAFGMKVNAEAFEKLLFLLPLSILHKYVKNFDQLESILFGLAGFLDLSPEKEDDYYASLKKEYSYLRHLHHLPSLSIHEWKFMRMRPYNFPTFRLAQFVGLLSKRIQWFEFAQHATLQELTADLENINASPYWSEHFHFKKTSKPHSSIVTSEFIQHLVLNAFVPLLFCYGDYIGNSALKIKALDWLQQLPAEKNNITRRYSERGFAPQHAGETQALLHLFKNYCSAKKCLDCGIGYHILCR